MLMAPGGPVLAAPKVHPENSSSSSSDDENKKSPTPTRTCCFWVRMCPPIKYILAFFKWLFLSKAEYEVLKQAKDLYKTVNVETGCCSDFPYKHLSKMERMYLHRILKDQARWGSERKFIKTFQDHIVAMQMEESDGGEKVTEGEFCNAVLYAVIEYMKKIVKKMSKEIKKEYKRDEKMALAP